MIIILVNGAAEDLQTPETGYVSLLRLVPMDHALSK